MTSNTIVRDYTGPCLDLIPRCRAIDVTRGGKVETVAMPTPNDERLANDDSTQPPFPVGRHSGG